MLERLLVVGNVEKLASIADSLSVIIVRMAISKCLS